MPTRDTHDNSLLPQSQLTPFGVRVRRWREAHDMNQQELADYLHITVNTLKHYLSGATTPSLDVIVRLADLMEVPIDDLLGREGYSHTDRDLIAARKKIEELRRESAALHEALASSHARIKDKDAHIRDQADTIRTQRISIKRSSIFMISLSAALAISVLVLVILLLL